MLPRLGLVVWFALAVCAACLQAEPSAPPAMQGEEDQQILDAFVRHVDALRSTATPERFAKIETAESICWEWCPRVEMALVAFRLTGDPRHLDTFVSVIDALKSRLRKAPDGYLGFRGIPLPIFLDPSNPKAECDVNITEFSVAHVLCEFAEIVRATPSLAAKYGDIANGYVALAESDLAGEKWLKRGDYVDLGTNGAIFRMAQEAKPERRRLTDPHNKQSKMCRAYLAMYRVTGKDEYFQKAIKLGTRFKRTLRLDGDGRYHWNYWDPAGDWDRKEDQAKTPRHWIGPEHRGGYHALTVSMAVALYDHGVVFDRADIDRFAATQTQICWNGSLENPVFLNTDGKPSPEKPGVVFMAPALARFEPRIRDYCFGPREISERLAGRNHEWKGGVQTVEYLRGKYLTPSNPERSAAKYLEQFSRTPRNADFLKGLSDVKPN